MAARRAGEASTNPGYVPGAVSSPAGSPPGAAGDRPWLGSAAGGAAFSLEEEHRRCRTLLGRLAAVFYAGSGLLGLVTLPLPGPGLNRAATASVCVAAVAAGVAIWVAPWGAWACGPGRPASRTPGP